MRRSGESSDPAEARARSTGPAAWIGALLATLVFLVVLFGGHASLLQRPPSAGGFFDAQAHSLLAGHWDVPRHSLEIEGFVVDGKTYEYFGPLPALLRLPLAAVTHDLDGRLGQISLLLAFVVAMTGTIRLVRRIRPLVRGDDAVTHAEQWATGGFVFVAGAGSVLGFLASRSWAYHESELWGAALALLAFDWIIGYIVVPTRGPLVLAATFTLLALLARGSVGLGPLTALGLVLVAGLWSRARRLTGLPPGSPSTGTSAARLGAVLAPLMAYVYVNHAKFGTFFSLPFKTQVSTELFRNNRAILAANGGSMFNLGLVPTGIRQYAASRPLEPIALFPWITFPPPPHVIGDQTIAWTPTSSYPAVMPLLAVLGVVGLVAVIRPIRLVPSTAALRIPVVAATIATIPTLAYAYVAQRYLSDLMPLGLLLATAGLHRVARWSSRSGRRGPRSATVAALVALGVLSVWFNVGLAVLYQRVLDGSVPRHDRVAFVSFQYALHDRMVGGRPPRLLQGTRLPDPQPVTLFAFPNCRALYWSDGQGWRVLEGGEASGQFRLRVRFPEQPTGWQPLVVGRSSRDHRRPQFVAVRVLPGNRVQFAFDAVVPEDPIPFTPGTEHRVDVEMTRPQTDLADGEVRVTVDGTTAYETTLPNPIIGERLRVDNRYRVGSGDLSGVEPEFTGSIRRSPSPAPLCRRLTRR